MPFTKHAYSGPIPLDETFLMKVSLDAMPAQYPGLVEAKSAVGIILEQAQILQHPPQPMPVYALQRAIIQKAIRKPLLRKIPEPTAKERRLISDWDAHEYLDLHRPALARHRQVRADRHASQLPAGVAPVVVDALGRYAANNDHQVTPEYVETIIHDRGLGRLTAQVEDAGQSEHHYGHFSQSLAALGSRLVAKLPILHHINH